MPRGNEGAGETPFPYLISPIISIAQLFEFVKATKKNPDPVLKHGAAVTKPNGSLISSGSFVTIARLLLLVKSLRVFRLRRISCALLGVYKRRPLCGRAAAGSADRAKGKDILPAKFSLRQGPQNEKGLRKETFFVW